MESPVDPDPGSPGPVPGDRLSLPVRVGLAVAVLVAVAWIALHAAVDRPAVRARVQARALELLQARFGPVELADAMEIDWALRVWLGPLRVPGSTRSAEPLLTVDRIRVRASLLAALSGRIEADSIRLYGVRLAPGENGQELEAALERLRSRRAPPGPTGPVRRPRDPVLHLRGLTVALPWHGHTIVAGPLDARVERRGSAASEQIELEAWLPGGGTLEARLQRSVALERGWEFQGSASLGAADLPTASRSSGLVVEDGVLLVEASGAVSPGAARATLRARLARFRVRGERLGPEPVGPLSARGEVELGWNRASRRLELRHGRLEPLGPLRLDAAGELLLGAEPSFRLAVTVPPVDYQSLVKALPAPLTPPLAAPRPPGALAGSFQLSGPLTRLQGWTVLANLDLSSMRAAARAAPPSPLLSSFVAHPDGDRGAALQVGPPNPAFVPLAELPPYVIRAVTGAEDAGFNGHQGFDFAELLDALAAGSQPGRVMRGGSTISQQLAKNLYLGRDRTVARKLREALVTVALEASLPKARLLEIYLNLIEWGPGVHGIGPAARLYFGLDARRLTPRQACFLAAIIPSPNRSHRLVAAGLGQKAYQTRVDDLLVLLNRFEVLSDEVLERSLAEPLHFAFGAEPGTGPGHAAAVPEADEPEADPDPAPPAGPEASLPSGDAGR